MYHRQVSSSPRSVPATRSSREPVPPATSSTRLSIAGVTGSPVSAAVCRVCSSAVSSPSPDPVGGARAAGRCRRPTARRRRTCATTNGAHSRPGVRRVARSVTRRRASCSPIRVPPPGWLKTDWPSCGVARAGRTSRRRSSGRPPRSAAGSCRSGPAGRSTRRSPQPSRRASSASSASGSTSVKSRVARPTHGAAGQVRRSCRCSAKWPVGWTCRSRSPVVEPR